MSKLLFLPVLVFCLAACAPAVHTEYVTVAVPARCDIERPQRPARQENLPLTLIGIAEYIRLLEISLDVCIGEE
jgi:hypothetical protein